MAVIEVELSVSLEKWQELGELYVIRTPDSQVLNLRMATGNEAGAYKDEISENVDMTAEWLPGGYTAGGVPEAVVDSVPRESMIPLALE